MYSVLSREYTLAIYGNIYFIHSLSRKRMTFRYIYIVQVSESTIHACRGHFMYQFVVNFPA